MNQGTYPLAAAMVNQLNRVDMISNNLANANTVGFKQEGMTEGSFNNYLNKAQKAGFNPTKINTITNTIPKLDGKYINEEVGPVVETGNELDFALKSPNTFFKVMNENGQVEYTRDGSFKKMDDFLVDSKGRNILNNDNEPIVTEDNFLDQISVVKIDFKDLEKVGYNNYKTKQGAQVEQLELNDDEMVQGALEKSNINTVSTMVSLIDAQRRFQQTQKGITTIDELNSKVIDKIGNNIQ
ncbi:flagellar biosynthesis protein FlgG [Malaciobacter molluscorum]|uniref:flagellar hook-basal body protein n=1 Tax=Malaciobacter molluscorum TaxID=1032072 RepID=UPI00100BCCBF|nr:flagellar hook-basal body complex protein [Malaciobacter molluscorum]RXJ95606.1 flagellar biosynthesis protein FlgG [Malaciobacter molluscorum]